MAGSGGDGIRWQWRDPVVTAGSGGGGDEIRWRRRRWRVWIPTAAVVAVVADLDGVGGVMEDPGGATDAAPRAALTVPAS